LRKRGNIKAEPKTYKGKPKAKTDINLKSMNIFQNQKKPKEMEDENNNNNDPNMIFED
jgi:hypothetical protein